MWTFKKYQSFSKYQNACFRDDTGQGIQEWTKQKFLKAIFRKFNLVHSWILNSYLRNVFNIETCDTVKHSRYY